MIEAVLRDGSEVLFVGSKSGLEEKLLAVLDIRYEGISTGKLRRYFSWQNFVDAFRVVFGILQAILLVYRFQPDVVFSKGGFVAFPVVIAAWLLRVPVVAHESDLVPGLANRLSLPFVHSLCVTFADTRKTSSKAVVTGSPIRSELLLGNSERGRDWLGAEPDLPVVVIVGGSTGAARLNTVAFDARASLTSVAFVVHVCGAGKLIDEPAGDERYRMFEYISGEWGDVLAAADVVVSRAGANALCELHALAKPNILVPLPTTSSRGDQIDNARYSEQRGLSLVLSEDSLTVETLCQAVQSVLGDLAGWKRRLENQTRFDSVPLIIEQLQLAHENRRT